MKRQDHREKCIAQKHIFFLVVVMMSTNLSNTQKSESTIKEHKTFVDFSVSVLHNVRYLSGYSQASRTQIDGKENRLNLVNLDFMLSYRLNSSEWYCESGIGLERYGYNMDATLSHTLSNYMGVLGTTTSPVVLEYRYSFLSIPIGLGRKFNFGNFSLYPNLGLSFSYGVIYRSTEIDHPYLLSGFHGDAGMSAIICSSFLNLDIGYGNESTTCFLHFSLAYTPFNCATDYDYYDHSQKIYQRYLRYGVGLGVRAKL